MTGSNRSSPPKKRRVTWIVITGGLMCIAAVAPAQQPPSAVPAAPSPALPSQAENADLTEGANPANGARDSGEILADEQAAAERADSDAFGEEQTLSEAEQEQVDGWIDMLGSADFATRERAASELAAVGDAVLPRLGQVAKEHADPEVRMRAGEIVKQLTRDDMKVRIEQFLAGKDVNFKGWTWMQAVMGDSPSVRELFVEMLASYPELLAAMEGTVRDRALELEKVVAAIEYKIFGKMEFPDRADALSLLLPTVDPRVPLEGGYEDVLIAVLQKPAVSNLHRDPRLSMPFQRLLGRWLPRSSLRNREELLFYGLSWKIPQTHALALRTLQDSLQTEALVYAFQAIALYGDKSDAASLAPFIDDARPAAELGFANGDRQQTQLGDVAMAAIARLHDIPLKNLGFARESVDDRFAFVPDDLGFPVDDDQARDEAKKKVKQLLKPNEGL